MSLRGAYLRAGLGALPIVGKSGGGEVPELERSRPGVEVDRAHVAKYARVCGFALRDTLPPTYPHVLAFGLHMEAMTDGSFPFPVIGMVHLTNRITQYRPVAAGETLDVVVRTAEGGPHPKGTLVALTTEVRVADELVWESESVNLARGKGTEGGTKPPKPPTPPREAQWSVPGDIGRRYADVSGDRNPIHMHDLSAKLFGFKRAIAHGMWTKARALAALDGRLAPSFTVDVRFEKPLFIPARVVFATGDGMFAVRDAKSDVVHLHGSIT
jgi:acyl dehydratase